MEKGDATVNENPKINQFMGWTDFYKLLQVVVGLVTIYAAINVRFNSLQVGLWSI